MSFWDTSDGENAASGASDEYEIPGGNLDPIPDGSSVLAMIDEAKWDDRDGGEFISLRWNVLAPDEYKNCKVFQKLWVTDFDPTVKDSDKAIKKRDKARRMLAAIDFNCGKHLAKDPGIPTTEAMTQHLTNKPMVIKCMVWSMDDNERPGEKIHGNWIAAVADKSKGLDVKPAKPLPSGGSSGAASKTPELDDEIPF